MRTVFRPVALLPLVLTAAGLLSLTLPAGSPGSLPNRLSGPLQANRFADSTALYLPGDLEATIWAESAMLFRPTSIDVDARGRVWVAEAAGNRPEGDGTTDGRITILTDGNGDGRADNQTIFAQDARLVRPLGVSVLGRNVYVSNAPDLLMYVDENGDDRPERAETVLTGFGGKNQRNGVHRMVAGPAGNYYISVGDAVPYTITDRDGWTVQAGTMTDKQPGSDGRNWVGGLSLRIKPNGSGLKVMADGFHNSQAVVVDSYGNLWQADTDEKTHVSHINWVLEGGKAGFYAAGNRSANPVATPGVMPTGEAILNSSSTALLMNEDEKLGLSYRGTLLCADARQHRIVAYKPEIRGAGYQLVANELVSGTGSNGDVNAVFEPVAMSIGPEGAIYVASWHEAGAKSVGRIYRIAPKGRTLRNPQIDLRNTAGQLAALTNPAPQIRMLGFNALKQQGDEVVEALMPMVSSLNAYHRSRAVFLLAQLGPEGQFEVERLLKSPEAQTRIVALRALRSITPENSKANPALTPSQQVLLPLLGNLSVDQSVAVRREVCVALRDMPYADCRRILANLVQGYDGQDAYYLTALSEAADGKEEALFADLRPSFAADPAEWDARTANLVWALHPASALSLLRKRAEADQLSIDARRQAVSAIVAMQTPASQKVLAELTRGSDKVLAASATEAISTRKAKPQAVTPTTPATTATSPSTTDKPDLTAMSPRDLLASKYGTYAERSKAVLELARTTDGARQLLDLIAENRLSNAMLRIAGPALLKHSSTAIRQQAAPYFEPKPASSATVTDSTKVATPKSAQRMSSGKPAAEPESTAVAVRKPVPPAPDSNKTTTVASNSDRRLVKSDIADIAELTGNVATGQLLFKANCSRCHVYNQKGVDVGPELTNVQRQLDKAGLIESIVYPNASITPGYESWLISTTTGQTYYGFIASETAQALVVKGVTGQKHTIPVSAVSNRRRFANSLMPSVQTMKLSQQQIADITAYLLKL
ncbi:PVC-type heme-binding CxxCH protein [uncultured Spirosoma sp.]|uniref:PVC-type heme-binding CxxCH protein n=1 Tax=uncultured Spirosoma sp. TaxID=278208 RepID=UPI00258D71CB|nr:PVC-type heme-binding CxxCH protein [uncultured Spirosoma sp.]